MAIDPTGIASLANQAGQPTPELNAKDVDAAKKFESYLVEMMIQQMRKTIPEGIFQSTGVDMFSSMFDQAVAQEIASAGGMGLAESISKQLGGMQPEDLVLAPEPGVGSAAALPLAPFAGGASPVSEGVVTSSFGYRADPFSGARRFHRGIDISAPAGTPIGSLAAGTVTMAGSRDGYGQVVMVEHDDGWRSLYAHCDQLQVQPGQRVEAGAVIGTVGSSGRSTGPHLHLELHHQGKAVDPGQRLGW